jgi:hypothetical protein
MKKELKTKVQTFFKEHLDFVLVCKEFNGLVYRDTLKRWCYPEKEIEARKRSNEYHNKRKDDPVYKENRRLKTISRNQTQEQKEYYKEYYLNNKEQIQDNIRKHRQEHLDQYIEKSKQHYQNNKERYKEWSKTYREENKERLQSLELARYHNDPITHLKQGLRMSLNRALKHGKDIKTNKSLGYLGCTIEEFKNYLENRFEEGMSWNNRQEWHLDHIIPLDKINEGYTLEQLCHYTNFQPLWKKDNLSKGNRINLELNFCLDDLNKEKDFYLNEEGNFFQIPTKNKIVLNFQPHFYDHERVLWSNPTIREKLLKNRCHYLKKTEEELSNAEILRGFKISGIHYGYSHFSPFWFKKFLKDYSIESVYDPCGGWGHRMIGLLGTSVKKYIYNDWDPRTVKGAQEISKFLNLEEVTEIHNQRSELWAPSTPVQGIFTCPPYFNKETYNNKSFKNLEDFSSWWQKVVLNCLSLNPIYFGVVIDSDHQEIISDPFKNYQLIQEEKLMKNSMHLSKTSSKTETLLVFKI